MAAAAEDARQMAEAAQEVEAEVLVPRYDISYLDGDFEGGVREDAVQHRHTCVCAFVCVAVVVASSSSSSSSSLLSLLLLLSLIVVAVVLVAVA